MAIKFSQFVVKTSSSDLSHIVGYNGVDNIQITPTNFLNTALTGTAGQVLFYDTTGVTGDNDLYWDNTNKRLGIGTTSPTEKLQVNSGDILINNSTVSSLKSGGSLYIDLNTFGSYGGRNFRILDNGTSLVNVKQTGEFGIGTVNPTEKLQVDGNIKVGDSQQFVAGDGNDLQISHNGNNTDINNFTGNLNILNAADDADIIFYADNGSGGNAEYFRLDGSATQTTFQLDTRHNDSVKAKFGNSNDLQIYHEGTDSIIQNYTGSIYVDNNADDQDIIFRCDDGSGGLETYFYLDGSAGKNISNKNFRIIDSKILSLGSSDDLQLFHNSTDSFIDNYTGNLTIRNRQDDGDIIFVSDDGGGGLETYFFLDGSLSGGNPVTIFPDNSTLRFGDSGDLQLYHDGSNSYVAQTGTGDLIIRNTTDDKDVLFQSDDGSGGLATYLTLDGSQGFTTAQKTIRFDDGAAAQFGGGADLRIHHNGTDSFITNHVGDLKIIQNTDDSDIIFQSDDGSGGTATYFACQGSGVETLFYKRARWADNVKAQFGASADLEIYHDGTDNFYSGTTGDMYFINKADDKDIIFQTDNGSGGYTTYFTVDGGNEVTSFQKDTKHEDNVKAYFGNASDLSIYHDGGNSFISDQGTGKLKVLASQFDIINAGNTEFMAEFIENAEVKLYHNNSKKFETTSTGIKVTGVSEYADNAAAIAGGLTTGDVYRTGDLLKIVH